MVIGKHAFMVSCMVWQNHFIQNFWTAYYIQEKSAYNLVKIYREKEGTLALYGHA